MEEIPPGRSIMRKHESRLEILQTLRLRLRANSITFEEFVILCSMIGYVSKDEQTERSHLLV
jgi:hypothetical protein